MADKKRKRSGFAIFITVMVILLVLCIALFIYGSTTNGLPHPRLPGTGLFALRTGICHG